MIIRIQSEGQYRLDDSAQSRVNELDEALGIALDEGEAEFQAALAALEAAVRADGVQLADEELVESDVFLPPSDATAAEVRAMMKSDGLIPG